MPVTVVERFGANSATGIAKETTFGTPVLPTSFLPMIGNTLTLDPGLFFPKLMVAQRDNNVFPLYGQYVNNGSITGALFPSNAVQLITGTIGNDGAAGQGVTGTGSTSPNTLNGAVSAGATSVVLTSATGYIVGGFIQIDVNVSTTTTSEVRKITTVATNTVSFLEPLIYAHLNAAATKVVTAPFIHNITQSNFALPSFTIEKNVGGTESLQFSGARLSKFEVALDTTNKEVSLVADAAAKHVAILTTPTTPTYVNENPYMFAECTLAIAGTTVAQATVTTLTVVNNLKSTFTLNQTHELGFLSPVSRLITGKVDLVFHNFDDTDWGYFNRMVNASQSATGNPFSYSLSLTHPTNAGAWNFTCPNTFIDKYADTLKIDDVVITSLTLQMALNLSTNTTITATLTSPTAYAAY
jgi:hypothetical protein